MTNAAKRQRDYQLRTLAALKRSDYDGRLPRALTGLKRWLPGRRHKLRRLARDYRLIAASPLFDAEWYLANNPDVAAAGQDPALHYVRDGARECRDPGPLFSTNSYLAANPDVAAANSNALSHFIQYGANEGRKLAFAAEVRTETLRALPLLGQEQPGGGNFSFLYVSGESNTPGHLYRVERYLEAARANGAEASWVRQDELGEMLDRLDEFSVLVIWRAPWDATVELAIERMRALGRKVVFDVDDLMTEPEMAQVKLIDGIRSQFLSEDGVRGHYHRVRQTMLASDLCFTTTEELAFYLRRAGKAAHVLPNGFDQATHDLSRRTAKEWRRTRDGLLRLGYAGGSRTHQRDLGVAIEAIARVLRENANCRLVLFRTDSGIPLVDVEEFPALDDLRTQIEWRSLQPLAELPHEMARFDINLAPLEFGNPYCQAKSELKFFEAALVDAPTVASPTGPFRCVIDHGKTGFLAATADDWYFYLTRLVNEPALREHIAHDAYHAALQKFGPRQRALQFGRVIDQLAGGARAARGFALSAQLSARIMALPKVLPSRVVFERDRGGQAEVAIVIPLHNYRDYVIEALDSAEQQTLKTLDLVVVDDQSTDDFAGRRDSLGDGAR